VSLVQCPSCAKKLRIKNAKPGHYPCPACGKVFAVGGNRPVPQTRSSQDHNTLQTIKLIVMTPIGLLFFLGFLDLIDVGKILSGNLSIDIEDLIIIPFALVPLFFGLFFLTPAFLLIFERLGPKENGPIGTATNHQYTTSALRGKSNHEFSLMAFFGGMGLIFVVVSGILILIGVLILFYFLLLLGGGGPGL
jgi:hypothetical protein